MKPWMRVMMLFILFLATVIVSAHPTYRRFGNEESVDAQDGLLNFAKSDGLMDEELLGVIKERHKRLSDQRRAELETLMALSKMTEKLTNVTRGGRQLDLTKYGRKKRSVFDVSMKNLKKLFRLSGKLGYKGNAAYPVIS